MQIIVSCYTGLRNIGCKAGFAKRLVQQSNKRSIGDVWYVRLDEKPCFCLRYAANRTSKPPSVAVIAAGWKTGLSLPSGECGNPDLEPGESRGPGKSGARVSGMEGRLTNKTSLDGGNRRFFLKLQETRNLLPVLPGQFIDASFTHCRENLPVDDTAEFEIIGRGRVPEGPGFLVSQVLLHEPFCVLRLDIGK